MFLLTEPEFGQNVTARWLAQKAVLQGKNNLSNYSFQDQSERDGFEENQNA